MKFTATRLPLVTPLDRINTIPNAWAAILAESGITTVESLRAAAIEFQGRTEAESYAGVLWYASHRQLEWADCLTLRNRLLIGLPLKPNPTSAPQAEAAA